MEQKEINSRLAMAKQNFYRIKGQSDGMIGDGLSVFVETAANIIDTLQAEIADHVKKEKDLQAKITQLEKEKKAAIPEPTETEPTKTK